MAEPLSVLRERFAQPDAAEIMAQQYRALLEQYNQSGNIDLNNRPIVKNPDGSISTVRSIGANIDGRETLLPTVSPDGKNLSNDEAVARYRDTGENLGRFDTVDQANAYARALHEQQDKQYSKPVPSGFFDAISNVGTGLARDIPRAANWLFKDAVVDTAKAVAALPKRAFESSERMRTEGDYDPAPIVDAALLPMGTGAIAGVPLKAGETVLGAGAVRTRPRGTNTPANTGSLNPLDEIPVTFQGKEPHQFTPDDWKAFGDYHGVETMGPLSKPMTYRDVKGNEFELPGGTEGKWTYADLLSMKANPINPANVDRELHTAMQQKLGRTMTPENLSDADVWNGLVFGMTSPNNPLFPNQLSASRLRLRTPEMLDDLSSMIPWKPGEEVTAQARKLASDNIASRFGLQAGEKGGLGVRGSADYSRVGELAQMFKEDPSFFRKAPNEDWGQAVERISSQVPGLSMKTGSFGTVWQDPANAAISAIDRHMARELEKRGGLFESPEARTTWENRGVNLWNKRVVAEGKPDDKVVGWTELMQKRGSDGFVGEMLLDHVGNAATPKFRMKGGEVNPNIPEHLANAKWVREPESVYKMGSAYKKALEENQKLADKHGLNLFMSQWMEWDRIRNRFEPHENMFPGLSKLPAMSRDQLRAVDEAHKATGHKTYGKTDEGALQPTRPYLGPLSQLGYLGIGGLGVAPLLQGQDAPN